MPINLKRYPADWKAISAIVRFGRAHGQCECVGQCGMHRPNPGPRRCTEIHGQPATFARGRVTLTTAHICTCDPPCAILSHLIATCQRCHLRIDRQLHARHSRATRASKKKKPLTARPSPATLPKGSQIKTPTQKRGIPQ